MIATFTRWNVTAALALFTAGAVGVAAPHARVGPRAVDRSAPTPDASAASATRCLVGYVRKRTHGRTRCVFRRCPAAYVKRTKRSPAGAKRVRCVRRRAVQPHVTPTPTPTRTVTPVPAPARTPTPSPPPRATPQPTATPAPQPAPAPPWDIVEEARQFAISYGQQPSSGGDIFGGDAIQYYQYSVVDCAVISVLTKARCTVWKWGWKPVVAGLRNGWVHGIWGFYAFAEHYDNGLRYTSVQPMDLLYAPQYIYCSDDLLDGGRFPPCTG
jgi:hypothetical protein